MPEIKGVHSGGDMLDIHLDNGNILLLDCALLLRQPGFEGLAEDGRVYFPQAAKNHIFWKDGPELTLTDIVRLMTSAQPEEQTKDAALSRSPNEMKEV